MNEQEIREELEELFENVYEINVFDNRNGTSAWVVLEEGQTLKRPMGGKLEDKGYHIVNHQESRKNDSRNCYLVNISDQRLE
jgi:hypothetical protein